MRLVYICTAMALFAAQAHGATVFIDTDKVSHTKGRSPSNEGRFLNTVFNFSARRDLEMPGYGTDADPSYLSDTSWAAEDSSLINSLTVWRRDGKTFDLASLEIPGLSMNWLAIISGFDTVTGNTVQVGTYLLYEGIRIFAETATGNLEAIVGGFNSTAHMPETINFGAFYMLNADPTIPIEGFAGLRSLTITPFGNSAWDADPCATYNRAAYQNIEGESGGPWTLLPGKNSELVEAYCTGSSSRFTDVQLWQEFGGPLDFNSAFALGGITVETDDLAPVPLPATGALMLSAVGAALFARRRWSHAIAP